jgi:hypothetical protein
MRDAIQLVGFIMTLQGISGAIDHLAVQAFMGLLLNFHNRVVRSAAAIALAFMLALACSALQARRHRRP